MVFRLCIVRPVELTSVADKISSPCVSASIKPDEKGKTAERISLGGYTGG